MAIATERRADVSVTIGGREITFETGKLAKQADGSVIVRSGDTMVLATAQGRMEPREGADFFPLTVDVEERMYAAGKIPGAFFRREGRPSEDAILTCRLTDRPLRPSFAKGLRNEIQVVATVLALHPDHLYDVVAINAASASTQLAGLPFSGPVGATRVAYIDGHWVAFPTHQELTRATFDMVVAGRVLPDDDVAIMMVEAEATPEALELIKAGADAPTEEVVAAGLEAAKPFIRALCQAQSRLAADAHAGETPGREYPRYIDYGDDVYDLLAEEFSAPLEATVRIGAKQERENELDRVRAEAVEKLSGRIEGREREIGPALRALTKKLVRQRIVR
ncbi:MAG TPA: hypothetical protein VF833_05855, partial [Gaiellaceae bacterium]